MTHTYYPFTYPNNCIKKNLKHITGMNEYFQPVLRNITKQSVINSRQMFSVMYNYLSTTKRVKFFVERATKEKKSKYPPFLLNKFRFIFSKPNGI